jgi:hypothetical protein
MGEGENKSTTQTGDDANQIARDDTGSDRSRSQFASAPSAAVGGSAAFKLGVSGDSPAMEPGKRGWQFESWPNDARDDIIFERQGNGHPTPHRVRECFMEDGW